MQHVPDKYCPVCGAIWVLDEIVGDRPTCQCYCVPVGTIRYDPVSKELLTVRPNEKKMTKYSLDGEVWREYDFGGRVYRIEYPRSLFLSDRGTTHRVVGHDGIVHCCPAPGQMGCVLRWAPKNADDPVQF